MADTPDHEHEWQDTGFATLEDCAVEGCDALRSAKTGRITEQPLEAG